jgi:hypothetical protein
MPASGEIYQFTLVSSYQGQTCENVVHMRRTDLLPTTSTMVQNAINQWFASQQAVQVTAVQYRPCRIKQMTPLAFDESLVLPSTATGVQGTTGANTTLSVVITKRTGVAGKTHRGRFYLAGYPAVWGVDRVTSGDGPTLLGTFAGELLAKFGEGGTNGDFVAGIYSRVIGGSFPFTLAGWQAITKWDPQLLVGNQRRRRLDRGI